MSELSTVLGFDHVVRIAADGKIDTNPVNAPVAPDAIDPDARSLQLDGWTLITEGLTGQDRYDGPWLHNSEVIEGGVEHRVFSHAAAHGGGYYVAIYGQYSCEACGGAGLVLVPVAVGRDETEEADCPLIAEGTCEPGGYYDEGWTIAYRAA